MQDGRRSGSRAGFVLISRLGSADLGDRPAPRFTGSLDVQSQNSVVLYMSISQREPLREPSSLHRLWRLAPQDRDSVAHRFHGYACLPQAAQVESRFDRQFVGFAFQRTSRAKGFSFLGKLRRQCSAITGPNSVSKLPLTRSLPFLSLLRHARSRPSTTAAWPPRVPVRHAACKKGTRTCRKQG